MYKRQNLLRRLETPDCYFEVMLPSRDSLCKGKKIALSNRLGARLGDSMIACVDADYDYLMQGATETSRTVCTSPYVFHTYVYAIENYQCYAPALHNVCVMATLNDHRLFDFEAFLGDYSETIWPLLVWSVWAYRYGRYPSFSLLDFYRVVQIERLNYYHPEQTIEQLRRRVNAKVSRLQRLFPQGRQTYKPLREELLALGLTPRTAYLYMRGHDLFDGVVGPMLGGVCEALRRERERDIRRLAGHEVQLQNELSAQSNERCVGREFTVLAEGRSKRSAEQLFGRTEQNKVVVFDRGRYRPGDYVRVRVTGCSSATLLGQTVEGQEGPQQP